MRSTTKRNRRVNLYFSRTPGEDNWVQLGSMLVIRSLDVRPQIMLADCHRLPGEVPERSNGAVSKTVVPLTGGPRVRIPPSPPEKPCCNPDAPAFLPLAEPRRGAK